MEILTECSLDKKLQGLQLIAQEKLQAIICSIPGKKDLILEPSVIKPLEHICSASWLKLKGIQRIYKFDEKVPISRNASSVQIFMIRSHVETFSKVLQQISEQEMKIPTDTDAAIKNYHVICVPTCFVFFQATLEEEGLLGLVQLYRFNWDLIYIDSGLISMEVTNVFSSAFMYNDFSLLPSIAQTLRILQIVCGQPDIILSYGTRAAKIVKMLSKFEPWIKPSNDISDISAIIVIDRDSDYVSSLLSPAIYAGLLLEVFNYRTGEIEIEVQSNKILKQKLDMFLLPNHKDNINKSTLCSNKTVKTGTKVSVIRMNSLADEIYGENRYKHFAHASSSVRTQSKAIGLEVQKLNSMKLDEMHDYVARSLPKITELKSKVMCHLNASEQVIKMLAANFQRIQSLEQDILNNVSRKKLLQEIYELFITDAQQYNTIRLLCLLHLSVGLTADELAPFVRSYCNYFGSKHLPVFARLARAGLLPTIEEERSINKSTKLLSNLPIPKFQQTDFQANANRLKLLLSSTAGSSVESSTPEVTVKASSSEGASSCPSCVFNGLYIPFVSQLSSLLLRCNSAEDLVRKLGMLDKLNIFMAGSLSKPQSIKSYANSIKQVENKDVFPLKKSNLLVFVVGGITYSEVAACSVVARETNSKIIVSSDSIISAADLIAASF